MSGWILHGWRTLPRVAVLFPEEGAPGWADAAFWWAQLEAWGIPADLSSVGAAVEDLEGRTTVVAPAAALAPVSAAVLARVHERGTSLLLAGQPAAAASGLLGLTRSDGRTVERLRFDEPALLDRVSACLPSPDADGAVRLDAHIAGFDLPSGWRTHARWVAATGVDGPAAIGVRHGAGDEASMVWFGVPAEALDWRATEAVVAAAEAALEAAAPAGLVGIWRWPNAKAAALVVDGDVDHPTGVDPECSRYVAPALETARRAGFAAYGIFAAAANVEHEPASFPPAVAYYNHSFSHPYSYWDPRPWEALDEVEMEDEIRRSNETFVRRLGRGDEGIFRLPHFQYEGSERTFAVLERLGYRAESSIGANHAITAGLPFHQAVEPWSERAADAAYARTHPKHRRAFLQLPISTDPTDPEFVNGCCSYNALGEGVRDRTADPSAYEAVLDEFVERCVTRRGLAHLFIDPPDAGYGRLEGDRADYAGAVERWLARCVAREDLAIMTTAGLTTWWLEREAALGLLACELVEDGLVVRLDDAPAGATLAVLPPHRIGEELATWQLIGSERT
jgi:peptidoglycan/xylan/chitin deacetylase (PgdA/CDA1 family)